jgi:predicted glycoside hydrolase/deacetylase ChbG (UPF0249 family)
MNDKLFKNIKLVVNADDFGMNSNSTNAIVESIQQGWISTTTIMTTMPGFEEACEIAHEKKLLDRIGIHFNLTEGQPLTDKIKSCPKFCDVNGQFFKSEKGHYLTLEEKSAVYSELEAQLIKLKKFSISPTHADSHHHVHQWWAPGMLFVKFCKTNYIPALRLNFNFGKKFSWKRKSYSKLFNTMLEVKGLAKTKYFCEIQQVYSKLFKSGKPAEVMVHPVYDNNGMITNYVGGKNFEYLIEKHLHGFTFVTYKDLME